MTNREIATILRNAAASYTIKNEKKFRFQIISYERAADAVENSADEVADLIKENRLDLLPGIGPSIKSHIEELLKKGKSAHLDWITQGIPKSVFTLMHIPGFGPKKAFRLAKEFNLQNPESAIEDLLQLAKQGKIRGLEGFGEKSEQDIIRGIEEFKKGSGKTTRMPLPYAFDLAEKLQTYLEKSKDVIEAIPLGSLRRMKETVGDIDIAVATDNPQSVVSYFASYPYTARVIDRGKTTASILTTSGKQIDLMCMPPDSFGSLLQHFTGSKNHNVHLREHALKLGLSLSEYGIKTRKNGKTILKKYSSEEKFYNALGLDFIPPEIREDTGEIEKAQVHKLPKLVELSDINGDLHLHSDYPVEPSHDMGKDSMEEMIKKAQALNYKYIGFSEHNPSISKHTKDQIKTILAQRKAKIEQLNKNIKSVRVINLLEVDILPDGRLAVGEDLATDLDGMIVSIHSNFSMNKTDMTQRILKGLSHKKAKIFAHPTGRLINQRNGYEVDFDILFKYCLEHNKALEINAWPTRLDLRDSLIREAVKKDVKMVINTDSHATYQMENMRYGVAIARRGWAEKKNILNTLDFEAFTKWLSS